MKSYNVISLILIAFCISCRAQNEPELRGPLREVDTIAPLQDHPTAQATPEQLKLEAATGLSQFQETIASINSAQTPMQSTQQPLQHSYRCTYEGCNKTFEIHAALRRHMHTHRKQKQLTCPQCNKLLPSRKALAIHITTHNAQNALQVVSTPVQSHTFSSSSPQAQPTSSEIQQLTNSPTSSAERYQCSQCPKSYLRKYDLKQHMLLHTNPELLTCPTCKKIYNRPSDLKKHMLTHTNPQALTCPACSKTFSTQHYLKNHMLTHTNPQALTCPACSKIFSKKSNLKQHMSLHTNSQAFECQICKKIFSRQSNLDRHILLHNNPKKFICPTCKKKFSRKDSLKQHIRRFHPQQSS